MRRRSARPAAPRHRWGYSMSKTAMGRTSETCERQQAAHVRYVRPAASGGYCRHLPPRASMHPAVAGRVERAEPHAAATFGVFLPAAAVGGAAPSTRAGGLHLPTLPVADHPRLLGTTYRTQWSWFVLRKGAWVRGVAFHEIGDNLSPREGLAFCCAGEESHDGLEPARLVALFLRASLRLTCGKTYTQLAGLRDPGMNRASVNNGVVGSAVFARIGQAQVFFFKCRRTPSMRCSNLSVAVW